MNTLKILLSEMDMGALVEMAEEGAEDAIQWNATRAPSREALEEVVGQVTDLVLALGAEREVMEAARATLSQIEDLEQLGQQYEELETFAVAAEILVRLAEDSGSGGEACDFVAEQVNRLAHDVWAGMPLRKVWAGVVEAYLSRHAHQARWSTGELTEEGQGCGGWWDPTKWQDGEGWWITEEATGLRFFQDPHHLPQTLFEMRVVIERAWECYFCLSAWGESGKEGARAMHDALVRDVRPGLLKEAWGYLYMEALNEEELKELPRDELEDLQSTLATSCFRLEHEGGRPRELLCFCELLALVDRILDSLEEAA